MTTRKHTTFRLPTETVAILVMVAKQEERSKRQLVERAIREYATARKPVEDNKGTSR